MEIEQDGIKQIILDPTILANKVVITDIPERLQCRDLAFNSKKPESYINQEAEIIGKKLFQLRKYSSKNKDLLAIMIKQVKNVLKFLKYDHYEIMYIYIYKPNEIYDDKVGSLKISELWKIYNIDLEFSEILVDRLVNLNDKKFMYYSREAIMQRIEANQDLEISSDFTKLLNSNIHHYTIACINVSVLFLNSSSLILILLRLFF